MKAAAPFDLKLSLLFSRNDTESSVFQGRSQLRLGVTYDERKIPAISSKRPDAVYREAHYEEL